MKREGISTRYSAASIGLLMVCAVGCRQDMDSSTRQARLAVATNAELEKQVARYEAQVADCQRQIEAKDAELAAVRRRNEDLQQEVDTGIGTRVNAVTTRIMDDNARLREENEALRAEITKLQAEQ